MVRLLLRLRRRVWGQREESGVKDRAQHDRVSGDGGHDFFGRAVTPAMEREPQSAGKMVGPRRP